VPGEGPICQGGYDRRRRDRPRDGQYRWECDVPPWITNLMAARQARIWLAEDKLDATSQWAQERGLDVAGAPTYLREMEYMVLARRLIAQGRSDETTKLLQCLLETVEPRGHASREIEILVLQASASHAGGEPGRAMTTLERALTLAEPGGFIRTFVDEGPPGCAPTGIDSFSFPCQVSTQTVKRILEHPLCSGAVGSGGKVVRQALVRVELVRHPPALQFFS